MEYIKIEQIITFILAAAGLITAIGGAVTYLKKWHNETKASKNSKVIEEQQQQIENLGERVEKLESTKSWHDKYIETMCKAMLALLNHNINGNSIDKLEEAKEEMRDFLIHRE